MIDTATADKEGLEVGQTIGVQAEGPVRAAPDLGIVKFGRVATLGGATLAGFDLPTAQDLFERAASSTRSRVAAELGVSAR